MDFITNEKEIIGSRYNGDFEFNEFKKFLLHRRRNLILLNFLLVILAIFTIINIEIVVELFFGWIMFFSVVVMIKSTSVLAGVGLIIFSMYNIITLSMTKNYLVLAKDKDFGIKWNKWQLKEIIFKNSILLEKDKNVEFEAGKRNYVLYLLVQYPTGSFRWYGVTNNKNLTGGSIKITKDDEVLILDNKDKIKVRHSDIIKEMTRDNLQPSLIVGVRIRSNVLNEEIIIKNLRFI